MKLFTLPNFFTLGNLFCGCMGIVFAFHGNLMWSAYLVGIAAVLDFLDGFVARLMNSHSPIGKELDSLADMTTFGVLPGVILYKLLELSAVRHFPFPDPASQLDHTHWIAYCGFLVTLFSALRLAKFNVDTRQSDSFIGVPTPACTILIASFPLILRLDPMNSARMVWPPDITFFGGPVTKALPPEWAVNVLLNPWFLLGVTAVMSFLLVCELPLFALKFKTFGWKGNEIRYVFLALSVGLVAVLQFTGIPLIIVLYVLLSVVNNLFKKKSAEVPQ